MEIKDFLPYIVSVITAIISAWVSITKCNKNTKAEIAKIEKQHTLDIEKEREKFEMEKTKMKLEHQQELEKLKVQADNQLSNNMMDKLLEVAVASDEVQKRINQGISKGLNKKKR